MSARYAVFIDKKSGKKLVIDTYKLRYDRMRYAVFSWANIIDKYYSKDVQYMVTLTYDTKGTIGEARNWRPGDIRDFMLRVRQEVKRLNAYCWVSELQENGNIHYHVLLSVPRGVKIGHADKCGWWSNGMSRTDKAKKGAFYICSYTGKKYQKDYQRFPKGARHFAVWVKEHKSELRFDRLTPTQKVYKGEGWLSDTPDYKYLGASIDKDYADQLWVRAVLG